MSKRKGHDISGGIDFTGGQFQFAQMVFFTILGWFSITLECFFRHDFGERYYTKGNWFIGFLVMNTLFFFLNMFFAFGIGSSSPDSTARFVLWWGYLILSAYHFWKIWVNAQVGRPQHSLYDGKSNFEPLGRLLLKVVNPLFVIVARFIGKLTLRKEASDRLKHSLEISPPFNSVEKFTKLYVEPCVAFMLLFVPGVPGIWVVICTIAHITFTNMRFVGTRHEELDITDGMIEMAQQKEDKEFQMRLKRHTRQAREKLKQRLEKEPEIIAEINEEQQDVLDILEEIESDFSQNSKVEVS